MVEAHCPQASTIGVEKYNYPTMLDPPRPPELPEGPLFVLPLLHGGPLPQQSGQWELRRVFVVEELSLWLVQVVQA